MKPNPAPKKFLLATMTNEPFQPVRLYYSIPDRAIVEKKLRTLDCTSKPPLVRYWEWLFQGEAASLRFGAGGYDDVPEARRPIILGRIRFPKGNSMTLETNSIDRAIEGAKFFAPRLGPDVMALRCRVVNRCFTADEGPLKKLMETLDKDVTVIDPRESEAALEREFKHVQPGQDPERTAAEFLERRIKSGEDVPLVEDCPLYPEDETRDFKDLSNALHLRFIRAVEHWRGNTHLTLTEIIVRSVQQGMHARGQRGRRT
jgi:hypothetical protein